MPPASSESQLTFLLSCIRFSNNGKVDFTEVAKECGIVSKGAAAKRYERMMKAHGIYQGNQPIRETTVASRPPKRAESSSGTKNKKRKLDYCKEVQSSTDTADDDEDLPTTIKPEPIKEEYVEPESGVTQLAASVPIKVDSAIPVGGIKQEPFAAEGTSSFLSSEALANQYQPEGRSFFPDFIHASAFEQPSYGSSLEVEGDQGARMMVSSGMVGDGDVVHDAIVIAD